MRFNDLTGEKFGKLTVLNRGDDYVCGDGRHRTTWNCHCDCGNYKNVVGDYLKRSKNPSCGCEVSKNRVEKNRIDHTGQKFGRLTIVKILWDEKPTRAICKCDCGNDYIGVKADITSYHTQSCGCLQSENTSKANTKDWTGCISNYGVEFLYQDYMNNDGQWMWKCKCGLCGKLFSALPAKINNGHITSCGCRIQSSNEEYIYNLLTELGAEFKPQYKINDCKHIYQLRFDFAILRNSTLLGLIEYDGQQHFYPVKLFGGEDAFKETQKRDEIKNTYCNVHDIPLLRIPYTLSSKEIKQKIYEYYLSLTTAVTTMAT